MDFPSIVNLICAIVFIIVINIYFQKAAYKGGRRTYGKVVKIDDFFVPTLAITHKGEMKECISAEEIPVDFRENIKEGMEVPVIVGSPLMLIDKENRPDVYNVKIDIDYLRGQH